jgi:hypothetical protein
MGFSHSLGSKGEELTLSISSPLCPSIAVIERTFRYFAANTLLFDHLVGAAIRGTEFMEQSYSAFTLAAVMIGVHRAISLFTSAASGC